MLSVLIQRTAKYSLRALVKNPVTNNLSSRWSIYYFAYGANIDPEAFHKRVSNIKSIGTAKLPGFKLHFNMPCEYVAKGYGSIHANPEHETWGTVYALTWLQARLLDILEWVPFGAYKRITVLAQLMDGRSIECYTYQARYPRSDLIAPKSYLFLIIEAAQKHGFPKHYIDYLANHPYDEKFEMDLDFCLIAQGLQRRYPKLLKPLVRYHDYLREKLCAWW